jgi:predicted transcriptional regulator of viral defense system
MKYLESFLKSWKTIFSYADASFLLWIKNKDTIKSLFYRLTKSWILQHLASGLYALPHFDHFEFATLLKKNSYISFETVLKQHSIIFQDYGTTLFLASDKSLTKSAFWTIFEYHKLRDDLLSNPLGIIQTGQYAIATAERAVCDRLYLSPNYYFDNIEPLDKEKLLNIAEMYNQRVILSVKKLLNAQ